MKYIQLDWGGGGVVTFVKFCWVGGAGMADGLSHYSLFLL